MTTRSFFSGTLRRTHQARAWMAERRAKEAVAARMAFSAALSSYARLFHEYPLRINMAISGGLCALGDVFAQCVERAFDIGEPVFNAARTSRMLVYGLCVCGPLLHGWYRALFWMGEALSVSYTPLVGSRVGAMMPWLGALQKEQAGGLSPGRILLVKVAADGLFFQAPFLNLYFVVMGLLEGRGPFEILEKAKAAFHRAWGLSILVWTPVQVVNFTFIPAPFQPALVSAVNVGWKTTLSLLNAMTDGPEAPALRRRSSGLPPTWELEAVGALRAEVAALQTQLRALREENEQLQELVADCARGQLLRGDALTPPDTSEQPTGGE